MTAPVHTPSLRPRPQGRNRPLVEETPQLKELEPKRIPVLRIPIKRSWKLLLGLGLLGGLLTAAVSFQNQMPVRDVSISIQTEGDQAFLTEQQVLQVLEGESYEEFVGVPLEDIHLENLENRLLAAPTIKHAEVYKRMVGTLQVEVGLRKAVARIVNNSGVHMYIDNQGIKFPISRYHTAYVPLVRGDFEESMVDTFACSSIPETLPVLNFVAQDTFWQAQISEVIIHQSGELTLLPTIGDTEIEFGFPINVEDKFSNLLDYYRQVAPVVGWDAYRRLNLKYQGQVVGVK